MGSRIVMGMGESTSWPASNRIIREWFPAAERGLANAIFGAGAAAGPAIGAVGISAMVAAWGWRGGFFVAGASASSGCCCGGCSSITLNGCAGCIPPSATTILRERDGDSPRLPHLSPNSRRLAVAFAGAAHHLGPVPDPGLRGLWRLYAADLAAELPAAGRPECDECRHADRRSLRGRRGRRRRSGPAQRQAADPRTASDGKRRIMLAAMLAGSTL